jgi:hypothetical protein
MADRLKDIWEGFARSTHAQLTTTDLSPLSRPSGTDRAEQELELTLSGRNVGPEGHEAVRAALDTLHRDIESKAKRRRRPRRGEGTSYAASDEPPSYELRSGLDKQLLADLQFTEARVRRSGSDYLTFARAKQEAWGRKRKKFLGLF